MLKEIAEYLNSQSVAVFNTTNEGLNQIYLGQIDLDKDTCIGLYEDITVTEVRNIGAESYEEHGVTILVHWSKNYETAVDKAKEVYDLFRDTSRFTTTNYTFWNFRCTNGQPTYVETRNDVYEFVINYLYKVNI